MRNHGPRQRDDLSARAVMSLKVMTVTRDVTLDDAYTQMVELGVRHAPVVEKGKLIGLVSDRDLLIGARRTRSGLELAEQTVGEVMTPNPYTSPADATVGSLARLMVREKIDAVPVVSANRHVVGLVTSTDLLELVPRLDAAPAPLPFAYELVRHGMD